MNEIFLISYAIVILFSILPAINIYKNPQYGKRSNYLIVSAVLIGVIGIVLTIIRFVGFDVHLSLSMYFTLYILYLLAFYYLEFSIHCQRIEKSFLMNDYNQKLKSFIILITLLLIVMAVAYVLYFMKTGLLIPIARGIFKGQTPFGLLYLIVIIVFTILAIILNLNLNNNIFNLQKGVIRKKEYLFSALTFIAVIYLIMFVIFNGFGINNVAAFNLPIRGVAFEFFSILNFIFLIRCYSEYYFQRLENQEKTIARQEESVELKNELINKVLNSPIAEDINIIKSTVKDSIERSQRALVVTEYKITGTFILRRMGNVLKVDSEELLDGYCTPLELPDINLKKQTNQRLTDLILRKVFDLTKIEATPGEKLRDWGERMIKRVIEEKAEVIIQPIPKEFVGIQRFIGLYPIISVDRLDGIVVVFKTSFESLFPEEKNAIMDLVDDLKVIFSIIEGKRIQSERNRLQNEMDSARNIQTSIVPKKIDIKGYESACFMETATEVGGDAYDYFPTDMGNYFGIGDVSGHGLSAGVTALIQQSSFQTAVFLSTLINKVFEPYEIYNIVNKVLYRLNNKRIGSDKFMTQNYFYEKNGDIKFAGAHEPAIMYFEKEERVIEIEGCAKRTAFMGLSPMIDAKTSAGGFRMDEGDILILYSDGIIEAKDHYSHQFGLEKLKHIVLTHKQKSPEDLILSIVNEVKVHAQNGDMKKHNGKLADDITLLVLKKLRPGT